MQYQDHVNIFGASWPRCREVSISDGEIHCALDLGRTYDLVSAYNRDPHLQFIRCEVDEHLLRFVRVWGPLFLSGEDVQKGFCSAPLEDYWIFQRWLRGIVDLLSAFKNSDQERESLQRFVQAEFERDRQSKLSPESNLLIVGLRCRLNIGDDVLGWLDDAPIVDLRAAIKFVLQIVPIGTAASLQCTHRSGKPSVEALFRISSLEEALRWMVWYDEFTRNPLVCCQACRKVFRPQSAHARKYCSYDCGHRIAAREWQRKQRKLNKGGA
jgi:hypothetical protein